MRLHPAALAALVALAGCLEADAPARGPTESWSKHACDAGPGATVSGNTPRLAALRGSARDVAGALAAALGETPLSDKPDFEWTDEVRYATPNGTVDVRYARGDVADVGWGGRAAWTPAGDAAAERAVKTFLARLGVPVDDPVDVSGNLNGGGAAGTWVFHRRLGEEPLAGERGTMERHRGGNATFRVLPLHDLSNATATFPREDAADLAVAYHRCALDAAGLTQEEGYALQDVEGPRYAIARESLAYAYRLTYTEPEPSHCGLSEDVLVDAATGAVLGEDPRAFACD